MKKISLGPNGRFAIVDDADFSWLSAWNWCWNRTYAVRTEGHVYGDNTKYIKMHRLIVGAGSGQQVDHINGNPLDNRRSNLRLVSSKQNQANRHKSRYGSSSIYKGVHWIPDRRRWVAGIRVRGKNVTLGSFHDEKEAALSYDRAARKHFGAFARLNFPHRGEQGCLRNSDTFEGIPSP